MPVDTGMFARSAPQLIGGASNIEPSSIPISPGVDAINKDAGFGTPKTDVAPVENGGFVKNITDFYGGLQDKAVTGVKNIFNKVKTGLKPAAPAVPGELSVEQIRDMTEAGLDVGNLPNQLGPKESILNPIVDTIKAIPPVVTAVAGPMAAMPGAGIEAAARLLPRISADPDKLIDLGSLEEAQSVLDKRLGAFSEFITTPEQVQAVENIGLASKPFEMAGEGWRLIGAGINEALKAPNVDPNIDPIPILEPFLASLGEISAVMGLPEILKKLKAMPPEQRALVTKEIADTVSSEGLTEAQLLRKLGPNSDLWKAKISQMQKAAEAAREQAATPGSVDSKFNIQDSKLRKTETVIPPQQETPAPNQPAGPAATVIPPQQVAPVPAASPLPVAPITADSRLQIQDSKLEKPTEGLKLKAQSEEKIAPAIPEFKDSEEATAFGMKASPEEIARVKELQVEFDSKARELVASGNSKDGMVVGQMASFMREAVEANANPERFMEALKRGEERKAEKEAQGSRLKAQGEEVEVGSQEPEVSEKQIPTVEKIAEMEEDKFGTVAEAKKQLTKELDVWMNNFDQAQWNRLGQLYTDRLKRAKSAINKLAKTRDAISLKDRIALSKTRNFDEMREIINNLKEKDEVISTPEEKPVEEKPILLAGKEEAESSKLKAQVVGTEVRSQEPEVGKKPIPLAGKEAEKPVTTAKEEGKKEPWQEEKVKKPIPVVKKEEPKIVDYEAVWNKMDTDTRRNLLEKSGFKKKGGDLIQVGERMLNKDWQEIPASGSKGILKIHIDDYIKAEEVKENEPVTERSGAERAPEVDKAGVGGEESGVVPGTEKTVKADVVRGRGGETDLETVRTGMEQGNRPAGTEQGEKPPQKGTKDRKRTDRTVERDTGNIPEFAVKGDNYLPLLTYSLGSIMTMEQQRQ